LLLWRSTVVTSSRSTALLPLAVAGVMIAVRIAAADSINLLRPAAATAPVILIDQSTGVWQSDDEAIAMIGEDCVAVSDRADEPRHAGLGSIQWHAGQPAWRWAVGAEPAFVYVICVDHAKPGFGFDGGLHLSAALSWSRLPAVGPGRSESLVANSGIERGLDGSPTEPHGPPELPWTSSDPSSWPPETTLDVPIALPTIPPVTFTDTAGNATAVSLSSDRPIILDMPEMIATPEPGSLWLVATGLAVAWRTARRKRED
jgi:hypothetical protein